MVEGGPEGAPPVKRKRGRPRKADVLAAQAAAAAAAAAAGDGGNGVLSLVAAPSASPAVPSAVKPDPKPRKPRKKKGEMVGAVVGVDANLVGKTVTGVLDGSFDAGYLLTVRVGDSQTFLRGVVFGPGLTAPVMKDNDVAPHAKHVKRDETIPLPPVPHVLVAPGTVAVQAAATAPRVPTATVQAAVVSPAGSVVAAAAPGPVATGSVLVAAAAPVVAATDGKSQTQAPAALPVTGSQGVPTTVAASAPLTAPTAVPTGA